MLLEVFPGSRHNSILKQFHQVKLVILDWLVSQIDSEVFHDNLCKRGSG